MDRRQYLVAVGAGLVAGCAGAPRADPGGVELPVPRDELVRGAPRNAIPAITDPAFGDDWSGVRIETSDPHSGMSSTITPRLSDSDPVIGVERVGEARAYPLRVLNWHEVVNDEFDGPVLITYCPLCGSAVTADRRIAGSRTVFGVSGLLWRSNLVLFDRRTGSLWSQLMATAIRGPETGATLSLFPSTVTDWGTWREAHPGTTVLMPPPRSNTIVGETTRNYSFDPYAGYADTEYIPGRESFGDDRLHPKTQVIGVTHGNRARAYPFPAVSERGVINDVVGGLPVAVAVGPDGRLVAYERSVGNAVPAFRATADRTHLRAAGSRWETVTGLAVDGPHAGRRLERANDRSPLFWFSWLDFHPDTGVYGTGGGTPSP